MDGPEVYFEAPKKPWVKLAFVGIYGGVIIPGFLNGGAKWVSSMHSRVPMGLFSLGVLLKGNQQKHRGPRFFVGSDSYFKTTLPMCPLPLGGFNDEHFGCFQGGCKLSPFWLVEFLIEIRAPPPPPLLLSPPKKDTKENNLLALGRE